MLEVVSGFCCSALVVVAGAYLVVDRVVLRGRVRNFGLSLVVFWEMSCSSDGINESGLVFASFLFPLSRRGRGGCLAFLCVVVLLLSGPSCIMAACRSRAIFAKALTVALTRFCISYGCGVESELPLVVVGSQVVKQYVVFDLFAFYGVQVGAVSAVVASGEFEEDSLFGGPFGRDA
eukprot:2315043-Rhodomonas_salina.1